MLIRVECDESGIARLGHAGLPKSGPVLLTDKRYLAKIPQPPSRSETPLFDGLADQVHLTMASMPSEAQVITTSGARECRLQPILQRHERVNLYAESKERALFSDRWGEYESGGPSMMTFVYCRGF